MFRIGAALLCDAVSIREGLLHVLGGGISALGRPSFPAPLDVSLAILLYARVPVGETTPYVIEGFLRSLERDESVHVFRLDGFFETGMAGEHTSSIAIPLSSIEVPGPGEYSLDLRLEGGEPFSVPFTAWDTTAAEGEPLSA